jgi:hypothetical protein
MSFPRTGSSMTAGIFAKHGVWVGPYNKGDKANQKGHFENLDFKTFAKVTGLTGIHKCREFQPSDEIIKRFKKTVFTEAKEPWLFKGSAMYWRLFDDLSPNYICVRRNKKDCLASNQRAGLSTSSPSYDYHNSTMDMLVEKGGTDVFTDEIIKGDYSSLEAAFKYCGLEFNQEIVDDFVSPELWHSK